MFKANHSSSVLLLLSAALQPQEYPGGLELGQKSFAESTANGHQGETRGATLDATSTPEAARRPR
jgi:hypothetical protein